MTKGIGFLLGVVISMCALAAPAGAQGTADIVGRVADSSGAILPGVTVTARHVATNVPRTTVTSETGDYTFTSLLIGEYEVKAELSGFRTGTSRVTLATGDRARVDFRLDVGTVNESIVVTSDVQQLQTDASHIASQLNVEIVQNVPIVGRNIINILQLTPGAAEGAATATISGNRPDDRRQTSAVSVNGMPENENRQMIDGVDNEERVMGGMGIKPSLEAIQEVNVKTNSYSADNGRTLSETEDHNHQIEGSLTKTRGAHSIKIGGGAVFRMFAVQQSQYPRSTYQFDSSLTSNGSGLGGNTFASFLLGYPTTEQRTHFPIHPLNRSQEPSVYIQDDWRASSWLTLNLGLRYEIFTPVTEAKNRISAFDPALGKIVVPSK